MSTWEVWTQCCGISQSKGRYDDPNQAFAHAVIHLPFSRIHGPASSPSSARQLSSAEVT
jgi:hypothetical protein